MHKFLTALARFFAAICALVFITTLVIALVLVNAENRLFKSETYKHALETTNTYKRLPALISQQLITNLAADPGPGSDPESGAPSYLKYLTVTDWENLITTLVTPEQAREISEQTLDQIFDYLDGKSDSVSISLLPIKEDLARRSTEAVKQILQAQPDCSLEQLADLTVELMSPGQGDGNIWCKPPAEIMPALEPLIGGLFQEQMVDMPDSVQVFTKEQGKDILPRIDLARLAMRLSLLVPLVFLCLMTLLAVRSRKSWLRWWGIAFIGAGALGLLTGLLIEPATRLVLTTQTPRMPASVVRFVETALELILAVAREVANPLMLESVLILAAGIGMATLAKYMWKEKVAA
jgi:hypothetical protein